jgi:hypothetical protein
MAVVRPLRRILLPSAEERRLLWRVVLEMSKRESTRERLPECLLPRITTGRFSNFFCERDSFRNYDHINIIITHPIPSPFFNSLPSPSISCRLPDM